MTHMQQWWVRHTRDDVTTLEGPVMTELLTSEIVREWHASGSPVLALHGTDGYIYFFLPDGAIDAGPYDLFTDDTGAEYRILIRRDRIEDWFPDAIDQTGALRLDVAAEMADVVNSDARIPLIIAIERAHAADEARAVAVTAAGQVYARAVAEVVRLAGNQTQAARMLGVDRTTVNKIIARVEDPTDH